MRGVGDYPEHEQNCGDDKAEKHGGADGPLCFDDFCGHLFAFGHDEQSISCKELSLCGLSQQGADNKTENVCRKSYKKAVKKYGKGYARNRGVDLHCAAADKAAEHTAERTRFGDALAPDTSDAHGKPGAGDDRCAQEHDPEYLGRIEPRKKHYDGGCDHN